MLFSCKMTTTFSSNLTECPKQSDTAHWAIVSWVVLALFAAVAPVWLSTTLPSSDGGSHIYNAMIAHEVRAHSTPFDAIYMLRAAPRADFASDSMLRLLGPYIGWELAERILASLILIVSGLSFYSLSRSSLSGAYSATLACWLATNWFFWMGFFDFSLSLAPFAALVILLRTSEARLRWSWITVSLFALYATHLFTFAIGTALFICILFFRVLQEKVHSLWLVTGAIPAGLLMYELLTGPVGHGGVSWAGWKAFERAVAGWAIGDFLITFTWIGLVVGTAVMIATWAGAIQRARRSLLAKRWDPIDLFALALFAGSLIVPDHIGPGLYT
jgi:hypothetical protein